MIGNETFERIFLAISESDKWKKMSNWLTDRNENKLYLAEENN